jgi:hypothetical protein
VTWDFLAAVAAAWRPRDQRGGLSVATLSAAFTSVACFEAIPCDRLMQVIEERVSDQAVLGLVRGMLRAGLMEGGTVRRGVSGTPQACSRPHGRFTDGSFACGKTRPLLQALPDVTD